MKSEKTNMIKQFFSKRETKQLLFLLPSILGVILFFIGPFAYLIYCSVLNNTIQKQFVGVENYVALFQNEAFRTASVNTILFALLSVPLAIIISLVMAVLLEANIPGKSYLRLIFLSPMMVPTASVILVWQVFFCYNGVVAQFVESISSYKPDFFHSKFGMLVILLLFLWKNLGYYMIIYMAALNEIPKELVEAARIDGASKRQQFFYIKLPYLSPTILFICILSLMASFKIFKEVYLLVGAYPYDTMYLLQHFINNTFMSLDYQKLATATVIFTVFVAMAMAILFALENKAGKDFEG